MADIRKTPCYHVVKHPAYPQGYTVVSHITQDIFDSAVKYEVQADDTFVASYPKNGTTWLLNIIFLMRNEGQPMTEGQNLDNLVPFLEFDGSSNVEASPRPRLIKTHLYYNMTPKNPQAKYVFVGKEFLSKQVIQ